MKFPLGCFEICFLKNLGVYGVVFNHPLFYLVFPFLYRSIIVVYYYMYNKYKVIK